MNRKMITGAVVVVVLLFIVAILLQSRKTVMAPTVSTPQASSAAQTTESVSASAATAAQAAVTIQNFAFSPATITIKAGESVTWTNKDTIGHSATADDGSFDTGVLSQGQSATKTFAKSGTYTYHCSVHPTMKGTIVVQ